MFTEVRIWTFSQTVYCYKTINNYVLLLRYFDAIDMKVSLHNGLPLIQSQKQTTPYTIDTAKNNGRSRIVLIADGFFIPSPSV